MAETDLIQKLHEPRRLQIKSKPGIGSREGAGFANRHLLPESAAGSSFFKPTGASISSVLKSIHAPLGYSGGGKVA